MSLVPNYDDSSSSSSSEDEETLESTLQDADRDVKKAKLPAPDFFNRSTEAVSQASVFKNAFTEAENAKEAILQKHVKMVDSKDKVVVLNGKRICWNYRKGKCRFGHNCKFAHDSDLQKTEAELKQEKQMRQTVVCENQNIPKPSVEELEKIRQEAITQNVEKRRKRPGLTQGLVPGKKVMRGFYKNQK